MFPLCRTKHGNFVHYLTFSTYKMNKFEDLLCSYYRLEYRDFFSPYRVIFLFYFRIIFLAQYGRVVQYKVLSNIRLYI